jgi:hypothetical protein
MSHLRNRRITVTLDDRLVDVETLDPSLFDRIYNENNLWSRPSPIFDRIYFLRLYSKNILCAHSQIEKEHIVPALRWVISALNKLPQMSGDDRVDVTALMDDLSLQRAALAILYAIDKMLYEETREALGDTLPIIV